MVLLRSHYSVLLGPLKALIGGPSVPNINPYKGLWGPYRYYLVALILAPKGPLGAQKG